jgi:hypothetical protein
LKLSSRVRLLHAVAVAGIALAGCSSGLPHRVWPQKDLAPAEFNDPTLARRLLIAARSSDFKSEVVQQVVRDLRDDRVYIRLIGVKQLQRAAANQYQAVLVLSTCMAGALDYRVTDFLGRVRDKSRVILLTTSSGGDFTPAPGAYDALSAASRLEGAQTIADRAAEAVRKRLGP